MQKNVLELRAEALRLNLKGSDLLDRHTIMELAQMYNGAGPEAWPQVARDVLTLLMVKYAPAVLIHDLEFSTSDGSWEGFDMARSHWIENCQTLFELAYPLKTWKMLLGYYRKERAYWYAVMRAGNLAVSGDAAWDAYKAAYRQRKKGDA